MKKTPEQKRIEKMESALLKVITWADYSLVNYSNLGRPELTNFLQKISK